MIHSVFDYLRVELRDQLGVSDTQVSIGHLHTLQSSDINPGLRLALVNIAHETSMRNQSHVTRTLAGQNFYKQPPVYLNLYILMAFDFGTYQTDLIRLSQAMAFFQDKPFFESENARASNPFPDELSRIILDLHTVDFEKLNHIWGMLGGTYFPSAIYKARLVKVDADNQVDATQIDEILVTSKFKTSNDSAESDQE
uniref:DUF4255 domain-containing protein n=1 Tax=Ningiella ruwaisensis TaxID=2364274 RepID=UPI0010A04405|nr:DUF4255 domain-containing protein [Ningiella ruwaisensis]